MTPTHFQSGPSRRDQGISKAGNPKARTIMLELAWFWIRYQPHSPLTIWFRERVGTPKGRTRRIAIVAVARKLLIALWRYLETGVVPTGAKAEDFQLLTKFCEAKKGTHEFQGGSVTVKRRD